jgi:hypothetical protein
VRRRGARRQRPRGAPRARPALRRLRRRTRRAPLHQRRPPGHALRRLCRPTRPAGGDVRQVTDRRVHWVPHASGDPPHPLRRGAVVVAGGLRPVARRSGKFFYVFYF